MISVSEQNLEILSKVKSPKFKDILRLSLSAGYDDYNNNAQNTNEADVAGLERFCKMLYIDWRQSMIDNYDKLSSLAKTVAESLRDNKIFDPSNIEKRDGTPFYNFLLHGYDKVFKNTGTRPAELQSGISIIPSPEENSDGFLHVYGYQLTWQNREKIEGRLYLNIKAKNLPKFATEAYKKCKERNLPFYFKFTIQDNRNDPFLFYTSYKNIDKYIEIIEEIKESNQELFEGAEKISKNLGNLNGYIGYGDEPTLKRESFNSVRNQAIKEIRNTLYKEIKTIFTSENKRETPFDIYCNQLIENFAKKNSINIEKDYYGLDIKEVVQEKFRKNIKKLILENKPLEDIEIIINGKSYVHLPTSKIDWLDELNNDFGKVLNAENPTQLRGTLAKTYIFPQGVQKEYTKKLNNAIKNTLVKGLKDDLYYNASINDNANNLLKSIEKEPSKLDKDALAHIILASANFIENNVLFIKNEKLYYTYNELLYDVYQDVLGKENVENLIEGVCYKFHISTDNLCFNDSTDIAVKQYTKKYEDEKE